MTSQDVASSQLNFSTGKNQSSYLAARPHAWGGWNGWSHQGGRNLPGANPHISDQHNSWWPGLGQSVSGAQKWPRSQKRRSPFCYWGPVASQTRAWHCWKGWKASTTSPALLKCWILQVLEALARVAKPCRTELTASSELKAKLVKLFLHSHRYLLSTVLFLFNKLFSCTRHSFDKNTLYSGIERQQRERGRWKIKLASKSTFSVVLLISRAAHTLFRYFLRLPLHWTPWPKNLARVDSSCDLISKLQL